MPLHDVGYRGWPHKRSLESSRWWILAITGISLVWRGTFLKRTFVLTWLPAIVVAGAFFAYEQSISNVESRQAFAGLLRFMEAPREIVQQVLSDPVVARHTVWSTLLVSFLRYPQTTVIVLLIGLIAPRLISYDIRMRGYLLLFSRPLYVWDYILGKSMILWFFLVTVTTLPAILLFVTGVLLSPDVWVVTQTWDLPLRVIAASFVMIIPTTAVALAFSASTVESRYASFAWFATWAVGWATYSLLTFVEARGRRGMFGGGMDRAARAKWELVSPYHVIGRIQQWCFGLTPEYINITPYLLLLGGVTVVALIVVYRRVTKVSQL